MTKRKFKYKVIRTLTEICEVEVFESNLATGEHPADMALDIARRDCAWSHADASYDVELLTTMPNGRN